jgi:hypothetical protein
MQVLCRVIPLGPAPEEPVTPERERERERESGRGIHSTEGWGDDAGKPGLRHERERYSRDSALLSAKTVAKKALPILHRSCQRQF